MEEQECNEGCSESTAESRNGGETERGSTLDRLEYLASCCSKKPRVRFTGAEEEWKDGSRRGRRG